MPDQGYSEWVNQVREATDIIQVVAEHVPLTKRGRQFWGICPFHQEKSPSFHVDPQKQLFYCFGCHSGGSVFTFLQQLQGGSFRDVADALADRAGIPKWGTADPDVERRNERRRRILTILEWSARYFEGVLGDREGTVGQTAIRDRGLRDDVVAAFRLGMSSARWDGLAGYLKSRSVSSPEMLEAGVVTTSRDGRIIDRWRSRLMFPIQDEAGQPVGFGGRAVEADQAPKYLNSSDTAVFQKGRLLYGAHLARKAWRQGGVPVLVEGYFDVVACHQAGAAAAVASLGTALTEHQARWLAREADSVVLAYDNDAAGKVAAERAFELLAKAGLKVRQAVFHGAKDLDEFRRAQGDDAVRQVIAEAPPFLSAEIRRTAADTVLAGATEKAMAVGRLRRMWNLVNDAVEKAIYAEEMARLLRIDPHILAQSLGVGQEADRHSSGKNRHNMERKHRGAVALPSAEVQLLAWLLRYPEHVESISRSLPEWYANPITREVLEMIGHTPEPASLDAWIDSIAPEARKLVMQAWAFEPPPAKDRGEQAIHGCVETLRHGYDRARWTQLTKQVEQGNFSRDVLNEVRQLQPRVGTLPMRRQGEEG